MCHDYKLDSLNWCCQLLPCSDGEKIWFPNDKFLKFYSCSHKSMESDHIYVSVGIVGLSHVSARQCASTQSCKMVAFLDHKMPDFMSPCCLVLTR